MARDRTSDEYGELKAELRSLLISSQQGCTEKQLLQDYAVYNSNKEIPYRGMGYNNLVELLMSMPDVARIDHSRVPLVVHGVADHRTVHIKNMVMTQKRKKKTGSARGSYNRNNFTNYRPNYTATYPRNQQSAYPPTSNGVHFQPYSHVTSTQRQPWDTSGLITNNTHFPLNDQNRSVSWSKPTVTATATPHTTTKMVASFPPKSAVTPPLLPSAEMASIRATPILDDSSSVVDEDLNYSADDELAEGDALRAQEYGEKIIHLRKRIRKLLLQYTNGVWLTNVHKLYKKAFDEELKLEDYKLKTLMVFFDCVSDFVDSRRDGRADSTDRLFLIKPNFIEAAKREQQNVGQPDETMTSLSNYMDPPSNEVDRPIVDLSSFVSLDFQYRSIECSSPEPFFAFLGDVENPGNIHLGNTQFIPKRDRMMAQLQEHYNQSSNESIYLIPFEQIHIHLCCVYHHSDKQHYRALIYHIDPTTNHDLLFLKLYLVDFGYIIPKIPFHSKSQNLKFLHKNFSTLSTQVYDCRLANICSPPTAGQWPSDASKSILDLCEGIDFQVEIVGTMGGFYSIYLWTDLNHRQSVNHLLIQQGFAVECDDSQSSDFEPLAPSRETNASYLNEKLFSKSAFEYHPEENHLKYFLISIQHGYYFVKHPFTKRPCLPCFELSRLLNKDEQAISQLNLIRDTELPLADSYQTLYDQLIDLPESRMCPHLHDNVRQPKIVLYDLSSIRDYLYKIKYNDGDVLDAFQKEYEDYERPGYWNEKKNSYINETNLQTHHDNLHQRQDLLNIRRSQLIALSQTTEQPSTHNELHQVNRELSTLGQELTTMETILPSANKENLRAKSKLSNMKMRETLFRIARPFDQQFALNIRFNHQLLANATLLNEEEDEIEERFSDLGRILKNILQFFLLESDLSDEKNRRFLNQAEEMLPHLTDHQQLFTNRVDIYNYCFELIEYFQPIIRSYVQRTDLIDTIY